MDDERAALIAAMYHLQPKGSGPLDLGGGKSRKIRVGIVDYAVPTVAYVESLERRLMLQDAELVRLRHTVNQLLATQRRTVGRADL